MSYERMWEYLKDHIDTKIRFIGDVDNSAKITFEFVRDMMKLLEERHLK